MDMKREKIEVVAGILVNDFNKVLVAQRNDKSAFAGKWEFPGGKIQLGENPKQCLIRELYEELSINIKINEFIEKLDYSYSSFDVSINFYKASIVCGHINLNVHQKYKWVQLDEIHSLDWLPANYEILNILHKIV